MKLFLTILSIASIISASKMPNQAIESVPTDSFITNTKQCYQCDLVVDNFIDINTMFNKQCANQKINCDNRFCSTMLSKNQYNENYRLQLGCVSKNYCDEINQYPAAITDNHITCCDGDLCNEATTIKKSLPFYLETNNTHIIADYAPVKQTIDHKDVAPNLVHDFSLTDSYLNNACIHKLFFTNQDNLIIALKNNDCYYKRFGGMPRDSLPAFPDQPVVKVIFLDTHNKTVTDLISSNTAITSITHIKNKNLLFFIADNNVFVYKLDKNKQLRKISQLSLNDNLIDIAINYNTKIIAVTNKKTVYFYNIDNIEQTKKFIAMEKQLQGANIYKLKYAPNRDILLVKRYDAMHVYTDLYNVANFSKITSLNNIVKTRRDVNNDWPVEYIKYNPYKLDFYYGKSAISPVDNLIVNLKVYSPIPYNIDARIDYFSGVTWYYKNDTNSYYTLYGDGGYPPYILISQDYVENGLDYFFATKNKPVMGFIMQQYMSTRKTLYLREIQDKSFSYTLNKKGYMGTYYFDTHPEIIAFKNIFHNARNGLFNNYDSKIAVYGHKRIQIYSINLDKYTESTTTPTPEIKTNESIKKVTSF
jgi:hypothetical protein